MKITLDENDNFDYFKNQDGSFNVVLERVEVQVSSDQFERLRSKIIEKYKSESGSKKYNKYSKVPESFVEEIQDYISKILEVTEKYGLDNNMEEVLACCDNIFQRKTSDKIRKAMLKNIPKRDH